VMLISGGSALITDSLRGIELTKSVWAEAGDAEYVRKMAPAKAIICLKRMD